MLELTRATAGAAEDLTAGDQATADRPGAAEADLECDELLVGRDSPQLLAQQLVQVGVAVRTTVGQIGGHALGPQFASADGARREAHLVEVHVDTQHAPGLAVERDRSGRAAGSGPADRVELADESS